MLFMINVSFNNAEIWSVRFRYAVLAMGQKKNGLLALLH